MIAVDVVIDNVKFDKFEQYIHDSSVMCFNYNGANKDLH